MEISDAEYTALMEVVEAANKVFRTAERNERLANRAALDELRNALRHYNEAVGK